MRKTLALFSVAALLVVLLVGCGQKTNSSTGGSGSGTTQSGGLNTGSTGTTDGTGGTDTNGSTGDTGSTGSTGSTANGSGSMTGGSTVTGSAIGGAGGNAASRWSGTTTNDKATNGSRNANASANAQLRGSSNSVTGTVATPGTVLDGDEQYRRMLANAHVHDTDGFLLDGENAQYVTW